ncbi:Uncharacterized iron-regulated protein [Cyclobacterium lianum]|uniref:Uncharacterized iron-regulated protein n=1 Tax=Cyclobacterium lianum TaxID=388280 RepID=A0A1M7MRW7_9BACT|nr:ChaN family lipoprotein [Cyclobacterium lianum]SHM93701.1 Uncharacterized iron-regulated protein [Cyclobacterium lianum]
MRQWILVFISFIIPAPGIAQGDQPESWTIIESASGKSVDISEMLAAMDATPIIVFGEEHDDSLAHVLQKKLYGNLIAEFDKVSLSLEMFERDVQLIIDEYLSGWISEDKLIDEGRAWSNYTDYAPLVNMAKASGQQVIAANVPGRYASMVARKGLGSLKMLDRRAQKYFTLFQPPGPDDAYLIKFNDAMGAHAQHMGPQYFHAQLLRDATMAESLLYHWRKNRKTKILHLTGRFHSDEGLGTVNALKKKKEKLKVMTISCFPSEMYRSPDLIAIKSLADYIILTKPPAE